MVARLLYITARSRNSADQIVANGTQGDLSLRFRLVSQNCDCFVAIRYRYFRDLENSVKLNMSLINYLILSPSWKKLFYLSFCFVLFSCFLRQDLFVYPWLAWNPLCRPGWPQTQRDLPAFATTFQLVHPLMPLLVCVLLV